VSATLSEALRRIRGPVVVLQPFQPKLGYRLLGEHAVVVDATHTHGYDRKALLEWLRQFVGLATWDKRRAPVSVLWHDGTLEEVPWRELWSGC
jgi:hypothetical protein